MKRLLIAIAGILIATSISSCSDSKANALANVHNISVALHGMDSIFANGNTINLDEFYLLNLYQNASSIISNLLEINSGDEIIFSVVPKTYYSIVNPLVCPLKKEQVQKVVDGVDIDATLVLCTTQSVAVETFSIQADKEIHEFSIRNIIGMLYHRDEGEIWRGNFSSNYESDKIIGIYREDAIGASQKNISTSDPTVLRKG